jgi:N-acetyl-gamma-glutamylphosphate reductase
MNVMCGFKEDSGLDFSPVYPWFKILSKR